MTTPSTLQTSDVNASLIGAAASNQAALNNIPASTSVNLALAQYTSSAASQALTTVAQQQNASPTNKDISYQILAEPLRAISPDGIINTSIASNVTMSQGVLGTVPQGLDNAAALAQKPSSLGTTQLKQCLANTQKKCTTIAQTEASHAELVNGHHHNVTSGSINTVANSFRLLSDTTVGIFTPQTNFLTQDYQLQANNSIVETSNAKLGQYQQKSNLVSGTILDQAQNLLHIGTDTVDHVGNTTRTVGITSHTTMGGLTNILANTVLTTVSGTDTQHAAYGNIGTQANGNISIVAAKSDTSLPTMATSSGFVSTPDITGGNIIIVAKPTDVDSHAFSLSSQGIFTSSTQSIVSTSTGLNVTSGGQGAAVTSNSFSFVGNSNSGVYVQGNKTFIGSFVAPLNATFSPSVVGIPALPVLPSVPNKQLQNCIPKAATSATSTGTFSLSQPNTGITNVGGLSQAPSATNTSNLGYAASALPNTTPVTPSKTPSLQNPQQISQATSLQPNGKLPTPGASNQASTSSTQSTTTVAFPQTVTGIYIDRYSPNSNPTANQQTMVSALASGPTTLFSQAVFDTEAYSSDEAFAAGLVTPASYITTDNVTSNLQSIVPASVLPTLLYLPFYDSLLGFTTTPNLSSLTVSQFPLLDPASVQAIITLIKTYPGLVNGIQNILNNALTPAAIGGSILSSVPGLNINLGLINSITQLPQVIQSGNLNSVVNIAKPYLPTSLTGSTFGSLLTNPAILNLGTVGLNPNSSTAQINSAVDSTFNNAIKGVLTTQLTNAIGPNYSQLIPLIKNILNQTKVGSTINPQAYIGQFSSALASITGSQDPVIAAQLYTGLSSLIKAVNSGNVTQILSGAGTAQITALLPSLVGTQVAGKVSQVFNLVKAAVGTYQAFKMLPQLVSLMNQYNIPAINQVGIALNCLGLFNQLKNLINAANALGTNTSTPPVSNSGAAAVLELAPCLVQTANSINQLDPTTLSAVSQQIGNGVDLTDYQLNFNQSLNNCFNVPQLNNYQAQITVTSVSDGQLQFCITNFDAFQFNPYLLPQVGNSVQLMVSGFLDINTNNYLVPYQTDFQYTPSIYTFIITQYDSVNNIGLAVFDNAVSTIVLQNTNGVLYQYPSQSIGRTLNPNIADSYLLL